MSRTMNKTDVPTASYESMGISGKDIRSPQSMLKPISLLKPIFDGFSLILVLVTWLILKYLVKPIRRPFLCADLYLYQIQPPQNVIPTWLLFLCAIIIPIIIILLSEGVHWYYLYRKQIPRVVYKIHIRSTTYNIPQWIGNLYIIIGVFVFSNCVNSLLTNIGKVTVGRQRPHFIPSCFEKYTYRDFCTDPTVWISNYTCIGETSSVVKAKDGAFDIRQSFPSGHASTAFCGLIFLALYIHKSWNYRNIGFLPYVMETGCFGLAAYIGITRITDHRHHGTDVLAGAILGTVIAIIAFLYVIRSLKQVVSINRSNETSRETDLEIASSDPYFIGVMINLLWAVVVILCAKNECDYEF